MVAYVSNGKNCTDIGDFLFSLKIEKSLTKPDFIPSFYPFALESTERCFVKAIQF